ncbi:alcohol dehydrogenase catalytic domain-containing protein [Bradyrhizobium sp. RDT10]
MKAAYFLGDRKLEVRDVPDPTPGPGEVILEIKASGMCGSDLKYYRAADGADSIGLGKKSDKPVIAGHEPCGVVAEIGKGVWSPLAKVGMRVMNHHYAGCGCCHQCRGGWTQMCDEGSITFGANGDGAHARFMKVPADSLVVLPDDLSFQAGAAISCGTGTAWGGLDRLGLRGSETIAIFGQGPVGLSGTQLATAMGARVIALDIDPGRLQRAKEFGAHDLVDARSDDVVGAIRDLTGDAARIARWTVLDRPRRGLPRSSRPASGGASFFRRGRRRDDRRQQRHEPQAAIRVRKLDLQQEWPSRLRPFRVGTEARCRWSLYAFLAS